MPFLLLLIGVMIAVSAYRGTHKQLWQLVAGDLTGSGSFIWWIVAIMVIGGIGYIPGLKRVSDGFLVLIAVVLFVGAGNAGFFAKFNQAIAAGASKATPAPKDATYITGLGEPAKKDKSGDYVKYAEIAATFI